MHAKEDEDLLELAVFAAGGVARYPLPPAGRVSLGRSEENDIRIEDSSVSRRHAIIHLGSQLRIEDLGSANGTRIRRDSQFNETAKLVDMRVRRGETVEFSPGEAINVGSTLIVVCRRAAEEAAAGNGKPAVVVRDPAMQRLYALAERVAESPLSVLLLGETGAGKEVLAERIHLASPRASGPFLRLNCAALSESLLESELFGHEKGSFTSAVRSKQGLLETADKGTVFLDEVGELPPGIQVKLLRVLEDRKVMRVGGLAPKPVDVRFLSATNRDLAAEVQRQTFRQDLFFRLNGISLCIPPLRERVTEIEPLARAFIARAAASLGRRPPTLARETVAALEAQRWPGNVRELRNVIERAVVLCNDDTLYPEHLLLEAGLPAARPAGAAAAAPASNGAPPPSSPAQALPPTPASESGAGQDASGDLRSEINSLERRRILDALQQCAGNQTQAAVLLGIPRRTFVAKLTAYGIPRPRKK